jgi:hypothetical protein
MTDQPVQRVAVLDTLRDLAKAGAGIEASVITTFTFDAAFYEEVLLRAFERAGSRLNIVLVDARQLAASIDDPLRQPTRAGKDYLLAPIRHEAAFHPKIIALLSEKSSILGVGSHNATDAGYAHNEEVTSYWGRGSKGPPRGILTAALQYCLSWLRLSGAAEAELLAEIEQRVMSLAGMARADEASDAAFLASDPTSASLWSQLTDRISSPVRRVSIVGPYFDRDLRMLNRIAQDLNPTELIVALQPSTAVLERPQDAPAATRFVDSSAMGAFWAKEQGPGFAHGKAIYCETDQGPILSLGSANPTGAAWLSGEYRNAEANLLLVGAAATIAASCLGLDALVAAPALSAEVLEALAARSEAQRRQERERDADAISVPVIVGHRKGDVITVAGLDATACRTVVWLSGAVEAHTATIHPADDGIVITSSPPFRSGGIIRVEGRAGPLATVIVNDQSALRAATRPKSAARLLDGLGRMDTYEGFDEIFDLLQRHVFDEPVETQSGGVGKTKPKALPDETGESDTTDANTFGPRGVSLASIEKSRNNNRLLEDGLVSEVIAALIRAMGPVTKASADGDGRNKDVEDAEGDELTEDDLARGLDAGSEEPDVNWPKMVIACRKRVSILINRVREKTRVPPSDAERAAWAFNRILLVLRLLQRLRTLPPKGANVLEGSQRPSSLVSVGQLREAFKLAMHAVYGGGQIAVMLERSSEHRASADRQLLDDSLLWTAQEIGADFAELAVFNEKQDERARRLGDRADVVIVAMSAAAHEPSLDDAAFHDLSLRLWDDAKPRAPNWLERHRRLGLVLQTGLQGETLPALDRPPRANEFAFWSHEGGLPRLVRSVTGNKVTLFQPGLDDEGGLKVALGYLRAIDLTAIAA